MKKELLILIVAIGLIPIAMKGQTTNGLVGHWTFDEGKGELINDESAQGNHGVLFGNYAWGKGKVGKGMLSFDGESAFASIETSESLNLGDQLTFAAWVRLNSSEGRQQVFQRHHYGFGEINTNGGMFTVLHIDDKWNLYPYSQTADQWVGEWHHIATTYDGQLVVNYLDGVIDTLFEQQGILPLSEDCLAIGSNCPWLDAKYNGDLDDVRIYNLALNEEEIKALAKVLPTDINVLAKEPLKLSLSKNLITANNPFTTIEYALAKKDKISIQILDITGKEMMVVIQGKQKAAGSHSVSLDASCLKSGMYLCRLKTSSSSITQKFFISKQ